MAHNYDVGECVELSQSRVAIIKYIGKLREMRGIWYGIEFIDGSLGSHNGTYKNTFYFHGADKRCEFIHKGDIRRRFKTKAQSARNVFQGTDDRPSMILNQDGTTQPQLNLNRIIDLQKTPNSHITLKLRCMCFADPVPIEIKIDINQHTMRHLKRQIVNECSNKTKLSLFKSTIDAQRYCEAVELYQMIQNKAKTTSRSAKRHGANVNIKAGNMAHCILKKNTDSFKKASVNDDEDGQNMDNVPLKYYKLKDGELLFVLFKYDVDIKIMFQKSLFVCNESKDNPEQKLSKVISDDQSYIHEHRLSVNMMDKFDVLYLKIMKVTGISNINSLKLLSNTFIYNKSMMMEKFICNEMDEMDAGNDVEELFLYFVHLHENDVNQSKHTTKSGGHHVSRTRNYSLMSNYSTYSTFAPYGQDGVSARAGVKTMKSMHSVQNTSKYTKVLLNFVSTKKSEPYTILDEQITIKELRTGISYRYKIECDAIKLNNSILDDKKRIKECNISTNDILHVYDEQNITIHITQSVLSGMDSKRKEFDVKINRKLTVKHIKYEISRKVRYPMAAQTLIMKDVLSDEQCIDEIGIKDGDTLRLVYNFGKRVRKLANQRIKIPICTFNNNKKFEMIVGQDVFIYEIMEMIEREKGVDSSKQQLLFHGVVLDKAQRLNYYNITHEVHLLIVKNAK
eukprot:89101_1